MNLENLISQYIDGELTRDEDAALRELLSQDGTAQAKFDASMELRSQFLEDAESITTPEDLYVNTEDIVLMKMLADSPEARKPVLAPGYYSMAAAVTLLFLISIFQISDLNNMIRGSFSAEYKFPSAEYSGSYLNNAAAEDQVSRASNEIADVYGNASDNNAAAADEIFIASTESVEGEFSGGAGISENLELSAFVFEEESENGGGISDAGYGAGGSDIFAGNESLRASLNRTGVIPRFGGTGGSMNGMSFYDINTITANNIEIMTMFGNDVLVGGFKGDQDVSVAHFSQSIAYNITEESWIGAEIGYTEYSYNEDVVVKLPVGKMKKNNIEELDPADQGELLSGHSFSFDRSRHLFWASAFYERKLFETNNLSVTGRLGAGASTDGLLAFGRTFAKYNVIGGLSLTAGLEGRVFSFDIPSTQSGAGKSMRSTLGLIYGVQLRF